METDGNDPKKIILIAGERRLKAAQNAGLTEISALFVDDNPEEVALIENSLRENLTAIEEAEAAGRLATELNYTQVQLCKILGKKPSPSHRPASPYRSVNIAMANELKMLFDRMDIDIWEVRSCHFLVGK